MCIADLTIPYASKNRFLVDVGDDPRNGVDTYVYGAVSPIEGELDWKISPHMNTEQMNQFLKQVSQAHREEFIVMVVDGASSHRSQELEIPENIRLHRLPGYSPELNPQEHIWDELREKEFPNRVFESMTGVVSQLEAGLPRMAANTQALRSLTAWALDN